VKQPAAAAAVESAQTDQGRGFESLAAPFQFLREQPGGESEEVVNNESSVGSS
jgi:hypothetical protein